MPVENAGNDIDYIAACLRRDGFKRLARSVLTRKISAQFAKLLARTVPRERLDEVTDCVERHGPRRPSPWFGWENFLAQTEGSTHP
jgi:hypothetical protein